MKIRIVRDGIYREIEETRWSEFKAKGYVKVVEPKAEIQFTVEAEDDIKSLTVEQLKNYAQEKGIDLGNAMKKADILEAVANSLAAGGK